MCSNTGSASSAGVSGSGGGDDNATHILKKPKRQRVPKRGPGVAELEKILREQENKVIHPDKGNSIVQFVSDHHNNNNRFSPPPPPQKTVLHGNKSTSSGRGSNGVRIAGSGIILPEEALLPTVWNSCESSIYEEASKIPAGYPISTSSFVHGSDQMHMLQEKHSHYHQYSSPTINLFPQSGSSSSENQSAGFYVHVEPPSNQRSSSHHNHYCSSLILPEEEKMAGTKRPRTFSTGSAPAPIFHCQASSPFTTAMHTLTPSFPNHTTSSVLNLQQDETLSRDYGAMNGNFLLFGSPATPSSFMMTQNSQQDLSKYHSLPFQSCVTKESGMDGSDSDSHQKKKPFYSFLIPEEQLREEETTLSLNNEKPRRETIDLNLKL
ncbi:hypothetical protein KPL70_005202 [Citrus sinensis]|uniref:Uncharacterized protein n=1 Tax=Citrus sinensis TaxID=2711 RepID=A0ACB8NHB8_CITSI|nr:protein SPEAR4 isoform X2 [Citrus sinensis]KAH9748945.1 hypothetical protein KPL70_005202 [Citrus sinensis]KAH9797231.1 hypothetical protein KPL71_005797 [Citrus sinensis]